jgi:hypothetical protein
MTAAPLGCVLFGSLLLNLALAPLPAEAGQRKPNPACRTGIETYRIVTTSPAFTSTIEGSCTFDPSTVEGTCTNLYSDSTGQRFTSVSVTRHATRGDVVDEVSVNPPLNLALGTTTTVTGPRMNSTGTSTLTHEGRRLTGITATSRPGGQTSRTTYSAWDAAGRPTAGTVVAGRDATAQSFRYDDAARTQTITASGQTCTQTFDENGNPALGRCGGGIATTTVLTTQQVCR